MATYHVDLFNGNDANDGLSWANAWKTFTKINSSTLTNDVVKFAKTPIIGTGVAASWVHYQDYITTEVALTKLIDSAVGNTWTSSLNVTGGTNSTRRIGASSQQFTFAAAFTTGKIAYKNLGSSINLSAYQKVSLVFHPGVAATVTDPVYRICLCSDTAGNDIVNSLPLPSPSNFAVRFCPVVLDFGSALGSNIQSIALYADYDPGAVVCYINNIFACNDLTINSFFSKNTETIQDWHSVRAIENDKIYFQVSGTGYTSNPYSGSSETLPLSIRTGAQLFPNASSSYNVLNNFVRLQGGWDTATDTQTELTFIDGIYPMHYFYPAVGNPSTDRMMFARFARLNHHTWTLSGCNITNTQVTNCNVGFQGSGGNPSNALFKNCTFIDNTQAVYLPYFVMSYIVNCRFDNYTSIFLQRCNRCKIENCTFLSNALKIHLSFEDCTEIETVNCSFDYGYRHYMIVSCTDIQFTDCSFSNCILYSTANMPCTVYFRNCGFSNFKFYAPAGATAPPFFKMYFNYCLFDVVSFDSGGSGCFYYFKDYNRVRGNNFVEPDVYTWQTAVKQGSDPGAWEITNSPNGGFFYPHFAVPKKLVELAVEGGKQTTITFWIKHTVALDTYLLLRKDASLGIDEDIIVLIAPNPNFQLVAIPVTPTHTGIVEIFTYGMFPSSISTIYVGSMATITA